MIRAKQAQRHQRIFSPTFKACLFAGSMLAASSLALGVQAQAIFESQAATGLGSDSIFASGSNGTGYNVTGQAAVSAQQLRYQQQLQSQLQLQLQYQQQQQQQRVQYQQQAGPSERFPLGSSAAGFAPNPIPNTNIQHLYSITPANRQLYVHGQEAAGAAQEIILAQPPAIGSAYVQQGYRYGPGFATAQPLPAGQAAYQIVPTVTNPAAVRVQAVAAPVLSPVFNSNVSFGQQGFYQQAASSSSSSSSSGGQWFDLRPGAVQQQHQLQHYHEPAKHGYGAPCALPVNVGSQSGVFPAIVNANGQVTQSAQRPCSILQGH